MRNDEYGMMNNENGNDEEWTKELFIVHCSSFLDS